MAVTAKGKSKVKKIKKIDKLTASEQRDLKAKKVTLKELKMIRGGVQGCNYHAKY